MIFRLSKTKEIRPGLALSGAGTRIRRHNSFIFVTLGMVSVATGTLTG
jgi:hypothetical protein